jgi:hypothetical protein
VNCTKEREEEIEEAGFRSFISRKTLLWSHLLQSQPFVSSLREMQASWAVSTRTIKKDFSKLSVGQIRKLAELTWLIYLQ